MPNEDGVRISTLILSIVNPLVAILLAWWLNYRISSSKDVAILELELDNGDDCIAISEGDYNDGLGRVPRCYVRLRLNVKGSPNGAKRCDLRLLGVYRLESNIDVVQLRYPNKKSLHWNTEWKSGTHVEKDLSHGAVQYVNLLKTQSIGGNVTVMITDDGDTWLDLQMNNTYRFEVQAIAGNAKAVGRMVDVKLGQDYNKISIERSRSIKY